MNSFILDLAIVLTFCIFLFLGLKKGVINAFLSFASSIFSGFLSAYFSGALASWTYFKIVDPVIRRKVETLILRNSLTSENVLNCLPKFLVEYLKSKQITYSFLKHIMDNNVRDIVPDKISEVFAPVIIGALKSVFVVALFVVLIALSRFLIKIVLGLFKSSLVRKTNTFLGGFFGLLKAYVVIMVVLCFLRSFICISKEKMGILSDESISNTIVFKKMYNNNPIYEFFEFV